MNEWEKLEQAILAQEALRATLGDAIVEATIATLREKQAALEKANQRRVKQRKYITVLFADVSGFTKMSERMDAEDVGTVIKALWQRLDRVILQYGGMIDKHMGDAVMALFGAPTAQENDPERAVRAALAMQTEVKAFCQEYGGQLALRIGINSGQVILDVVGTTREYTAMGDAVNVASRMETAAPVGGILISQDTYQHVQGLFEVEVLLPMQVKGKADPIEVYVVKRALPHVFAGGVRGLAGVLQPMIGREQQLHELQDAFDTAVSERELQMITLAGEMGLGKTRLLEEFSQWLTAEAPLTWYLKGRTTYTSPYALIRNLFAIRFDIREQDSLEVLRQKLEQGMIDLLGEEGLASAHFIGQLVGYDFADSPYLRGLADDPQQVYEQALHDVVVLLETVATQQPLVIFLEDAHWADEASLDFVMELALRCQELPLLILTLARPSLYEKRPYWGEGRSFHTRLDLTPLSRRASQRLVRNILHQLLEERPSAGLLDLIVANAEGNPFYMEELVRMFYEDGTLLHFQEGQDVRVPPTLFGVLQARLDRLEAEEQTTVQQAAVIGRIFWDKAIDHLRQGEQQAGENLPEQFDQLRQRRFIEARVPSTFADASEYRFHNSLLRDTAYEAVLMSLRRRYHRLVAVWLAAQYGSARVAEKADEIGSHYEQAGAAADAAQWYGRAGDQAARTYALAVALQYYERALGLLGERPSRQRLHIYRGLSKVRYMQAQYEESVVAAQQMRTMATTLGDKPTEAEAWNLMALAQAWQGHYAVSWESAQTAESLAREAAAYGTLTQSLLRQGWNAYRLRQLDVAVTKANEAMHFSQQTADARQTADIRYLLLAIHNDLGRYEEALQYGQESLELSRALGDKYSIGSTLAGLGAVAEEKGDLAAALGYQQEALAVAESIGDKGNMMTALLNLGETYGKMGEGATAVAHLQQLLAMPESADISFLPLAYASLAHIYVSMDEGAQALSMAQQAVILAQARKHPYFMGKAWQALATVLSAMPLPPALAELGLEVTEDKLFLPLPVLKTTAAVCFAHSTALFASAGMKKEQVAVLEAWAEMEKAQEDMTISHQLQEQVSLLRRELFE